MKSVVRTGAAALALSVAFFVPPGARAGDRSWWLDVEAGAEYDDNVAVACRMQVKFDHLRALAATCRILIRPQDAVGNKRVATDSGIQRLGVHATSAHARDVRRPDDRPAESTRCGRPFP